MLENEIKTNSDKVLNVFFDVIKDYTADSLLLSGGLDTSIIACTIVKYFRPHTITVGFANGNAPDIHYSKLVADHFNLQNRVKIFNLDEAAEAAIYIVKKMKSFDPVEIRNDITIYVGMKYLQEAGYESVITGDGGDELFAGYSFLSKLQPHQVDKWIRNGVKQWSFSAKPLGESLGLKVLQPFLDERIVDLALSIPAKHKIAEHEGTSYGKYILRIAFENSLSSKIVWRIKDPIEAGSGSSELSRILKVTQTEFSTLSEIMPLKTQEEAYYFKLYYENFGIPPEPKEGEKACHRCGGGTPILRTHCKICGEYPI